ncbi:MAG TPA: hypothetical protein VIM80_03785, partial [Brevefilum sp.]
TTLMRKGSRNGTVIYQSFQLIEYCFQARACWLYVITKLTMNIAYIWYYSIKSNLDFTGKTSIIGIQAAFIYPDFLWKEF